MDPAQRFPSRLWGSVSTAAQKGGPSSTLSLSGQRTRFLEENGAVTFGGVHQDRLSTPLPGPKLGPWVSHQATLVPQSLGWPLSTLCWPPGPCYRPTSEPCRPQLGPSRSYSDKFHCTGWSSQKMAAGFTGRSGRHREAVSWLGVHSWQVKS